VPREAGGTPPSDADIAYLSARGVAWLRLAIQWEDFQPTLNAALDATRLAELDAVLRSCYRRRMPVVIDLHNYARYRFTVGGADEVMQVTGGTLNAAHLSDFWVRMSVWLRADPQRDAIVRGLEIMNEPHDMPEPPFTVGATLHDFTTGVGSWTGPPVRDTTIFADGAAVFTVPTSGAEYLDGLTTSRDLSAYGDTLRYIFGSPASNDGHFFIFPRARRGPGNPNGADGSPAPTTDTTGAYLAPGGTVTLDWEFGTDQPLREVGFYPGGSGRSTDQPLHLDRVEVGSGTYGAKTWEDIATAVVTAIRDDGESRLLYVATDSYSSAAGVAANHPTGPWIPDPGVVYVVHHYWDSNAGGTYPATYADELAAAAAAGF